MRARRVMTAAVAVMAGAGLLCGCAARDDILVKSFVDQHGRACTYLLVEDTDQDDSGIDFDAGNIDCDYPPSRPATGRGRP